MGREDCKPGARAGRCPSSSPHIWFRRASYPGSSPCRRRAPSCRRPAACVPWSHGRCHRRYELKTNKLPRRTVGHAVHLRLINIAHSTDYSVHHAGTAGFVRFCDAPCRSSRHAPPAVNIEGLAALSRWLSHRPAGFSLAAFATPPRRPVGVTGVAFTATVLDASRAAGTGPKRAAHFCSKRRSRWTGIALIAISWHGSPLLMPNSSHR